jgi:hypothetical protein
LLRDLFLLSGGVVGYLKRILPTLLVALGLLAVLDCHTSSGSPSERTYQAKNVVILVIDGPRQSEMWGDPSRIHIPHLNTELAPLGAMLTGFRNNGPTYTNSGHAAITTGFYEEIENSNGTQLPSHAGIFQYFLRNSSLPKEKAWVITSKDKLAILGDTDDAGWKGQYLPSLWCGVNGGGQGSGYAVDSDTVAKVKSVLSLNHPRLMLINLKQPDSAGHTGVWADYLTALEASDAYAAEIWHALQADPEYANKTAFFITHDHGRHLDGVADGFVSHGDGCLGCRRVALLALGPDFRAGGSVSTGGELIDLPVTVADMLGFGLPGTQGRVLDELMR